jgi:hypothetical protein
LLQSGGYNNGVRLSHASKKMLFIAKWRFAVQIALRMNKYGIFLSFSLIGKSFYLTQHDKHFRFE